METSSLVDDTFRAKIPFHRGAALLELSNQTVDPAARERLRGDAHAQLESYASSNSDSLEAAEARLQLATAYTEQGRRELAQIDQLPSGAAFEPERARRRTEARATLEKALPLYDAAAETFSAQLQRTSLSKGTAAEEPAEEALADENVSRQDLRGRLAQVRVMAAQTKFELAQTHPADSQEYRQELESLAKELAALYEEHSRWLVGFYARLYEGRCYQALTQYPLALGCYEDILSQSNLLPAFRPLVARASRHRAECHLAQEKYDAAIEMTQATLRTIRPPEAKEPEWLALRFRLAEALQRKAETLPEDSLDRRKLVAAAREAYREASAAPNEFQAPARLAAASLGRGTQTRADKPRNFQEAYERGKEALAAMNAAKMALPLARNNNPTAIPDLEAQAEQGKLDARENFEAALALRDDDTDLNPLNEIRYFLCWLSYDAGDYYRAAVLGEFLARRYADHAAAASAAKLAMASFEWLYLDAVKSGAGAEFESNRVTSIAEFITRRWPDSEDANAAYAVLVSQAIRNNRVEDAERLLDQVAEESRPRLELQLGNAMWGRFLELSQRNPDSVNLASTRQSALRLLTQGYEAARSKPEADEALATAALYLAQAETGDGDFDEAIRILEDPAFGPLSLMASNHPATDRPAYKVEVFKTALRAYVSATPPQGKKAVETMDDMESALAGSGAAEQLSRIYLGLGMTLDSHIRELRERGQAADADRVSGAFVELLDRIASQEKQDWAVRHWLAQTYLNLGRGDGAEEGTARNDYLTKSRDAYRSLVDSAAKNPKLAPSASALLGAKLQLGECLRELGEYNDALDIFSSILKEKETSLAVQRAAALTYEERAQAENHAWFERAIHGGYKVKSTGKNRIWGWLRLAQVAERASRSNPEFRDAFFEARYHAARCRFLAATMQEGDGRQRDLARAKQSIRSMVNLYPRLGGDEWRSRFDALTREIQKAANEKETGLAEFRADVPPESTRTSGRATGHPALSR